MIYLSSKMGRLAWLPIGIFDLCPANNRVERSSYLVGRGLLMFLLSSSFLVCYCEHLLADDPLELPIENHRQRVVIRMELRLCGCNKYLFAISWACHRKVQSTDKRRVGRGRSQLLAPGIVPTRACICFQLRTKLSCGMFRLINASHTMLNRSYSIWRWYIIALQPKWWDLKQF
jgi:hypothetical protein